MLEAYLSRQDMVAYYDCGDFPFNFAFLGFGKEVTAEEVKGTRGGGVTTPFYYLDLTVTSTLYKVTKYY